MDHYMRMPAINHFLSYMSMSSYQKRQAFDESRRDNDIRVDSPRTNPTRLAIPLCKPASGRASNPGGGIHSCDPFTTRPQGPVKHNILH
ncbi:unnamed protein product [Arabidopsis lyrata]|nr:unnamed protein product [Arabidopsis lyrata]